MSGDQFTSVANKSKRIPTAEANCLACFGGLELLTSYEVHSAIVSFETIAALVQD